MSAQTTAISMLYINRSMLKTRSVLIVLLICIFAGNVFAQNAPRKEKLNIKLTFSANVDDTGLKNQTKSYVEKGLKQLGDIIFTDKNYTFGLAFFVFEPKTKAGKETDIVIISVIATKPLPDGRPIFIADTFKACNRRDLRKACEILVAQLDDELLSRKSMRY